MQSKAKDVDTYLTEVPEPRLEVLTRLRDLCREVLDGYQEGMTYGMPCYSKDGVVAVAFASQKQYISLYIMVEPVMDQHRPLLTGLNLGKGCIRYRKPEQIDFKVVKQLLIATRDSDSAPC